MTEPYNQDRPALFEELRFYKRQQWYIAASAATLNAAVIAATRGLQLHWSIYVVATLFVLLVALGCVRLLFQLQRSLADVRLRLDRDDSDPATRGVDIVYQLASVVVAVAIGVLILLWVPQTPQCPQSLIAPPSSRAVAGIAVGRRR